MGKTVQSNERKTNKFINREKSRKEKEEEFYFLPASDEDKVKFKTKKKYIPHSETGIDRK